MAAKNREEFEQIVRNRTGMDQEVASGILKQKDGTFEFVPKLTVVVQR